MQPLVQEWFRREILPHEAALLRFLRRKLRSDADIADMRHDTYVRVLEAAERSLPTSPKSFLFSVARNLLIDQARRERVVAIDLLEDMDVLNVLVDEMSPERRVNGRQQLQRVATLFRRLPQRCREVVWLRRIEDLSQRTIASQLGIAEATVEKHLVRGVRMLTDALYGEQANQEDNSRRRPAEAEPKDGI